MSTAASSGNEASNRAACDVSPLPPLRQELTLTQAPASPDGSPTWTLHDPASNRFYQLGWVAFEILSRWSLGSVAAVVRSVNAETTASIDAEDVAALARFLAGHHLTLAAGAEDTARLARAAARQRLSLPMWLLKHYLFFRVPLLRPMPFLRRVSPWIAFAYRPVFWRLVLALTLLGLYLVSRQWDSFVHTFRAYTSWHAWVGLAFALSFAKVLHELGHAFTAYRHGCRVPTMGVALLVMWPMLYTDTGEAWKLESRRARLEIGAAGVLAELALAGCATLLWNFLPDGPLRAGVFMLATSTWVVTLAINASPFTRFDGYYLLSDWLNVANLHERSFALGRWWLRERLFGFGDAPPEPLPQGLRRFLIGFALITWLYRFALFLSIALLVFHFFFRALGLVLMCVEIGWFLVLPILRELDVWRRRRGELRWNRQTLRTALLAAIAALVLLLPWQSAVHAPAVLGQAEAQTVYAPRAAQIAELPVREGQRVAAGDVLARLTAPDLDYALASAELEAKRLQWEVEQQPFDEDLRAQGPALGKRLETARELVAGYTNERARLILRAPFDGRVVDVEPSLRAGDWLRGGEALLGVVGGDGVKGDAFVDEAELPRVVSARRATFVADWPERGAVSCAIENLDRVNVTALDEPYVASVYGGGIASVKRADGTLAPLAAVFRVRLGDCDAGSALPRELAGEAIIAGRAESLLGRGVRRLAAWLRREAAF